ncbi:hypothetical protein BLA60_17925 [Actinophytocola xinjiangensis]|uniref:HTH cro/C1-type domain-containing protein n=1 Tax=Actinophytocola xinjiangensis TaxID=485602 RepID=A0A7Z0WLB3_9PSEU|nr:helix-turn-helix domain-containing protein [Actinophytocola xinjiangensis]OLF09673.1 hypothetical protein BLA60_17925 [Actinophytocola xinjiangensis]
MGRRERPLDPTVGPVARFADGLRRLRQEAGGITYRVMARKAHYSAATLAQAASGARLPSLEVLLAYVDVCGGDCEEWERRWRQTVREVDAEAHAAGDDAEAPYLGLARFDAEDHERFFGRDLLVDELEDLLSRRRLVVVTGPSGSGKSSLLHAGLVPRLRRTESRNGQSTAIRLLTPGEHPADTHAEVLDPQQTPSGTVVVVDQFEEVFTLCIDRAERTHFLDRLHAATERGVRVIVAVRADFYGHLTQHRALTEAAHHATLLVATMRKEELRQAIVRPAALYGLVVERTLTTRILHEVADEPGGLPLMSHALQETWRRRKGRVLTEAAFDDAGGLHGAITHTAENFYQHLTDDQAETARRILLRLVNPGQGNQDTRRSISRTEVIALGPSAIPILNRLAHARLVTLDGDIVSLAHEAVLSAWPRLHNWIDTDRERLRVQRQLTEAARTWQTLNHDPGSLYRGVRLTVAEQYCATPDHPDDLTRLEQRFLTASLSARKRNRRARRTGRAALSVLLVLGLIAAMVAWQQNEANETRRVEAEARRIAGVAASLRLSDPQTAMQLSLAAWRIADLPETRSALLAAAVQPEQNVFTDPDRSTQTMRQLSADGRTLLSIGREQVTRWNLATNQATAVLPGLSDAMTQAGFPRADTQWLPVFSGTDQKVSLYDLTTGRRDEPAMTEADRGAEMSPSGRILVVYDVDGSNQRIQLWDPRTRRTLLEVNENTKGKPVGDINSLNWARVLSLMDQFEQERRGLAEFGVPFLDATMSADDRFLAVCVPGEQLRLWDVTTGRRMSAPWLPTVSLRQCVQEQITFSADGSRLAVVDDTGVRTWHTETGQEAPAVTHAGLTIPELSKDGAFVAASDGEELLVWRLVTPRHPVLRHRLSGETVKDIKLDTEAGTLRYLGGPDNAWGTTVHTLTLTRSATPHWSKHPSLGARFSPDGTTLAIARPDTEGEYIRFLILDKRTGKPVAEPPRMPCSMPDDDLFRHCTAMMSFNSTGNVFAYSVTSMVTEARSERIELYDIPQRRTTAVLDEDEVGPDLTNIAFSPDDRSLLITGILDVDGTTSTRVWDLRRRTTTRTIADTAGDVVPHPNGQLIVTTQGRAYRFPSGSRLPAVRGTGKATALAFSPNGDYLAAGDASGRVALWDGQLTQHLGVLTAPDTTTYQYVSALAFSPDGQTLAVAADEGTLQLWDTTTHLRIGSSLPTPGDTVRALAFSPDGRTLHAAGDHTPLQTYDITPDKAAQTVCQRVTNHLTSNQWQRHLPGTPYQQLCPH